VLCGENKSYILLGALNPVKQLWQGGEKDADEICQQTASLTHTEPLAKID